MNGSAQTDNVYTQEVTDVTFLTIVMIHQMNKTVSVTIGLYEYSIAGLHIVSGLQRSCAGREWR